MPDASHAFRVSPGCRAVPDRPGAQDRSVHGEHARHRAALDERTRCLRDVAHDRRRAPLKWAARSCSNGTALPDRIVGMRGQGREGRRRRQGSAASRLTALPPGSARCSIRKKIEPGVKAVGLRRWRSAQTCRRRRHDRRRLIIGVEAISHGKTRREAQRCGRRRDLRQLERSVACKRRLIQPICGQEARLDAGRLGGAVSSGSAVCVTFAPIPKPDLRDRGEFVRQGPTAAVPRRLVPRDGEQIAALRAGAEISMIIGGVVGGAFCVGRTGSRSIGDLPGIVIFSQFSLPASRCAAIPSKAPALRTRHIETALWSAPASD